MHLFIYLDISDDIFHFLTFVAFVVDKDFVFGVCATVAFACVSCIVFWLMVEVFEMSTSNSHRYS